MKTTNKIYAKREGDGYNKMYQDEKMNEKHILKC